MVQSRKRMNRKQKGGNPYTNKYDPDSPFFYRESKSQPELVPEPEPEPENKTRLEQYKELDDRMKKHIKEFFVQTYNDSQITWKSVDKLEKDILDQMLKHIDSKFFSKTFHKITTSKSKKEDDIRDHIDNIFKTEEGTELRGIDAINKLKEMYKGIEQIPPLTRDCNYYWSNNFCIWKHYGGQSEHNYKTWFELYEECKSKKDNEGECKILAPREKEDNITERYGYILKNKLMKQNNKETAEPGAEPPAEGGKRRTRKAKKSKKQRKTKGGKKTAKKGKKSYKKKSTRRRH